MRYSLLFAALVVVALVAMQLGSSPPKRLAPAPVAAKAAPVRPRLPPRPSDRSPPAPDEPAALRPTEEMREEIAERVRGAARPGMTAFRVFSDLYVDHNLDFARRQAEAEGLTLDQVRELTYFGLLVLATQRVSDVEEMLGKPLTDEQRETLSALMNAANSEFKEKMRALVASGASEAERWNFIRSTQAEYLIDFYASTGMTEDLLDDLLAGNMNLPGAPINTEPPTGAPPPAPADHDLDPARPN
jgi:hypothetical protein